MSGLLFCALTLCAAPLDVAAEEREIRAFLSTRQDAFIREDSKWLSGHFTENGEHIDSFGRRTQGRAAIEKSYRAIFDAPQHHGVKTVQTIDEIRCVTADVAVINGTFHLSNLKDETGKPLPDRSGHTILVLVKQGKEWMIDILRSDIKPKSGAGKKNKVDGE